MNRSPDLPLSNLPPPHLPGLRPEWSRVVRTTGRDGGTHTWHVLDTHADADPAEVTVTLLCVHGNPTWSYLWRALLAGPPAGCRVVAPDQLGMGWSERLGAARTAAQRIDDLGDLTDALGIDGPVVTVGHDWGGAISLGWALAHRSQLRGVVLTNTAVALTAGDRGPGLIRLAHARLLRTVLCRSTPVFVRGATALSRPPLAADVRAAFAAPYATRDRRAGVEEFVADIPFRPDDPSADAVARVAEGIRDLSVPALLLWGPRDPVFGERYLEDLRERLPQVDLHRFERASHLVTEDAPEYVEAIRTWVAALDATPGPAPTADPPLADLFEVFDRRRDDPGPAVVEPGGRSVSWAQLHRLVDRHAAALVAAGLRPGDRVSLLVPPSVELTALLYAVWRAGGSAVLADRGLGWRGLRRALRSARPRFVVGGPVAIAAARALRIPGRRVDLGTLPLHHDDAQQPSLPPDAECAVLFTSGATGPAKGVVYRHRQVSAQLEVVREAYGITAQDRLVAAFAPFALLGPALGVTTSVPDIDVTAPDQLTAPLLADAVTAVDATMVFAAPAALRRVVATASRLTPARRAALGSVRLVMSAGAPVPLPLLRSVADLFPAAEPHTPYGMTEALPVTDVSLPALEEAGLGNGVCVGRPLPSVRVAVSALDARGSATGPVTTQAGITGEILVAADHVKDRYDALFLTQQRSSRDPGWHRTGDVGHLDPEGRLWVEGRLQHVVTGPSGPVTPVGLEQRIEAVDGVEAAAVVGVGPPGTQAVVAVVVPERARRRRGSSLRLADPALAARIRATAGHLAVAAVLVTGRLPVDIRHASKVDRTAVGRAAGRLLAGHRGGWARIPLSWTR